MGGVTANWHLSELDIPEIDDPFTDIAEVGRVIDLTGDVPQLADELRVLCEREIRYAQQGIGCGLKEDGQDCWKCPSYTEDYGDRLHLLCRLGRQQQETAARLDAIMRLQGEADELAEAAGVTAAMEHAEGAGLSAELELAAALA